MITSWCWGDKYGHDDVAKLAGAVKRRLKQPHRFVLFTEWKFRIPGVECRPIRDFDLTKIPGCFARLRTFDPDWQKEHGFDDRIVCLDLDMVITGGLDEVFNRPEPFTVLTGINGTNPCPYNGSVWMLQAGFRPDVWSDFSVENYRKHGVPFHAFPDDQGWFWHKLPGAAAFGPKQGVYGFQKRGWPGQDRQPPDARIVAFPGWRSPKQFEHLKWVKENWRA